MNDEILYEAQHFLAIGLAGYIVPTQTTSLFSLTMYEARLLQIEVAPHNKFNIWVIEP